MEVIADLASHRQQLVLLRVKGVVPLQQKVRDLARRNVEAPLAQLFEQPALSDVVLVHLQEHVLFQMHPEVRINSGWPRRDAQAAVGQTIHGAALARRVSLDDQVLDHEVPIAFQPRPGRQQFRFEHDRLVDLEILGFGPLV